MSYAQSLLADVNKRIEHAQSVMDMRELVGDGVPLTVPQRALIETQLNMLSYELQGGVELMPCLEDINSSDDLIMLGLEDLLRKILVAVYEGLVRLVKWLTIQITKLFSRARGLVMQVRDARMQMGELRDKHISSPTFTIRGDLAKKLAYASRFALTFDLMQFGLEQSKSLADILMAGTYPATLTDLGQRLSGTLNAIRTDDPLKVLSITNSAMEKAIYSFGFETTAPGRHRTTLLGNYAIDINIPTVKSLDPVGRSRELQTFSIDYVEGENPNSKLTVDTLTVDQLNQLLGHVENGLLLVVDYDKRKVGDNLLRSAGGLQTQLNKVLRELDHLRDKPELNDCMIALSRYMTAYAAWVQDPIEHYARYFLNLNASLLQVCRMSMRHYS